MTVAINKDATTTEREVVQNKHNLLELEPALLENDIEAVIFGDHEFPMEHYVAFQPIVKDLVDLLITHVDAGVRKTQDRMAYDIGKAIDAELIHNIIYAQKIDTTETVMVKEKPVDVAELMNGGDDA